jgi:Tol biopolymer transport system component
MNDGVMKFVACRHSHSATFRYGWEKVISMRRSHAGAIYLLARLESAASLIVLVALFLIPESADATFPGTNGRIALVSEQDGDDEIYAATAEGEEPVQLTQNQATDTEPAWDQFGVRIAFASNLDGDFEIFVMNADGSGMMQLTKNTFDDRAPVWSPDGKKIAFVSNRTGNYDIFSMEVKGDRSGRGTVTQLTNNPNEDREPDWSSDGKKIAFVSNRDGDDEIFIMQADGNLQTQVSANTARDAEPSWSPDGTKIAFVSNREGDDEIFVIDVGRAAAVSQLTENEAADRNPVWSPDGKEIAFASDRLRTQRVFAMTAFGSAEAPLVTTLTSSRLPAWATGFLLKFPGQDAKNVKVDRHGHFVEVEFDQVRSADKPRVELWKGDEVKFQIGPGPAAKHWKIKVTHLEPYTEYELKIVMHDPSHSVKTYIHPTKVKTAMRRVTVQFRWVKVHDDGDWGDCGEFEFDFKASGKFTWNNQNYVRFPPKTAKDQFHDICDETGWDPSDQSLELFEVSGDTIGVSVVGVDEDMGPLDIPYTCTGYGGCKSLGEWAEGSTTLNLVPEDFTSEAEKFDHFEDINAGYGDGVDGNPRFTWHIRYFVRYEVMQ